MEDFKHEVYNFTKQISKSSLKKEYDEVIMAFYANGGSKSIYNEITVAKGHQFLFFFIAESYKDEAYEKLKMIIPTLSEKEKNIFGRCHSFILYINNLLCEGILSKYPNISKIINPYSNILVNSGKYDISDIIKEFNIEKIKSSFKKTKAYEYIVSYDQKDVKIENIPEKEFEVFYHIISREYANISIDKNVTKDMESIIRQINNPSNKGLIKFMLSLVSIRYMLSNLNQLIYQKFCNDKLFIIDDNSIITYNGYGNSLGYGYIVLIQSTGFSLLSECGDLVLFSGIKEEKKLCMIESIEIKFGHNEGGTTKLKLRDMDAELNPLFSTLVRKF